MVITRVQSAGLSAYPRRIMTAGLPALVSANLPSSPERSMFNTKFCSDCHGKVRLVSVNYFTLQSSILAKCD